MTPEMSKVRRALDTEDGGVWAFQCKEIHRIRHANSGKKSDLMFPVQWPASWEVLTIRANGRVVMVEPFLGVPRMLIHA